jgi:hypothetical protein
MSEASKEDSRKSVRTKTRNRDEDEYKKIFLYWTVIAKMLV